VKSKHADLNDIDDSCFNGYDKDGDHSQIYLVVQYYSDGGYLWQQRQRESHLFMLFIYQ